MAIVLGDNRYGKAENRLLRVYRDRPRHEIRDVNVSTSLRGDFAAAHLAGDQSRVLPTDSQKNTCYAYAKERGLDHIEDYALALAHHFVDDVDPVTGARVQVDQYAWERIAVGEVEHDHSFVRAGREIRTTVATVERGPPGPASGVRAWVVSGLKDLVLLKTTGSEFAGFLRDRYTTLAETRDRIMSTSLACTWRYTSAALTATDWTATYDEIRAVLLERFAVVHSLALQQTLWEMGKAVLGAKPEVAEIRLSAPNIHHFVYDLERFGLDNPGEVFHVDDRPYGLIQVVVARDDAESAGPAWQPHDLTSSG